MNEFKVHVLAPHKFKTMYLWAWSSPNGGNAFNNWPGKTMETDLFGDFVLSVPEWVNSIIVSSQSPEFKSAALNVSPRDCWLELEGEELKLSYNETRSRRIIISLPDGCPEAYLWAWNDGSGKTVYDSYPGLHIEKKDGESSVMLPAWADRALISLNEGKMKSENMVLPFKKELYIELAEDMSYKISDKKPEKHAVPADNVPVHEEPKREAAEGKPHMPESVQWEPEPLAAAQEKTASGSSRKTVLAAALAAAAAALSLGIFLIKKAAHRRR